MSLTLITPPTQYPVSLVEVKSHCNILHTDTDALLDMFLAAATDLFDGPSGLLGRCLCQQSWEYRVDDFPRYAHAEHAIRSWTRMYSEIPMRLPIPPLVSVDSIKYVDLDGNVLTWASSNYDIKVGGEYESSIFPLYGTWWPIPRYISDAVRVQFTAGYPQGRIPSWAKLAINQTVSHWYEHRDVITMDGNPMEVPMTVKALIATRKLRGG